MMTSLEKAILTQLANIQKKTGMSLKELSDLIKNSDTSKQGEIYDMLKAKFGLGHEEANVLIHAVSLSDGTHATEGRSIDTVLDEIYTGPKAGFRPIHETLMKHIEKFGEFEIAPKKGFISLRRKRQFAIIGPKTNSRFELGINAKDIKKNRRLLEQPKGSMCDYIVNLTDTQEVDTELITWLKSAYEDAG